jgi:hypothetical protein
MGHFSIVMFTYRRDRNMEYYGINWHIPTKLGKGSDSGIMEPIEEIKYILNVYFRTIYLRLLVCYLWILMGCWIWGLDFMVIRSDMIYLTVEAKHQWLHSPWSLFFTSGTTIPQNHKSFQVGDLLWLLQLHSTATVQPEKDNPGNH